MSQIKIKDLSLNFHLYHNRTPSLKEVFSNLLKAKSQDSYSSFKALNNISLEIKSGERVGIIGHNGAGKSTLLKVISKVYESPFGTVEIDGILAPLLEIGAGFHQEFTGRENIYLNGAILGISKAKLMEVEHEVIAFAGIEDFADTAVKYYSTGMYMRLAFSLATAIQPDILLLDEIFAGGDAAFMSKAKERVLDLINKANILVMVSHDLAVTAELCTRGIWIDHGRIVADGQVTDVIDKYINHKAH
jgi:ABC-type polysaccharide/polyol phosphate transport system ATPase subunit